MKPAQLQFSPIKQNKFFHLTSSIHLTNTTNKRVAFRLLTKIPAAQFIGPLCGVVAPWSTYTLSVKIRHQEKSLPDIDDFVTLESSIAGNLELQEQIIRPDEVVHLHDLFFMKAKENGRKVYQVKLRALCVETQVSSLDQGRILL